MSQSDQGLLHKKKLIFFPKEKDNTPIFTVLCLPTHSRTQINCSADIMVLNQNFNWIMTMYERVLVSFEESRPWTFLFFSIE